MKPSVLVVTVVHRPDDTRIRERLIRSLSKRFDVFYASSSPGPTDRTGLRHIGLPGGRLRRNLAAFRVALSQKWDVMVVHDPELIPCALVARLARRRPVVFDLHEDYPAAAHTRAWLPRSMRGLVSTAVRGLLRLAERHLEITLAEPGYARLFARSHVVFPNYPDTASYPSSGGDPSGPALYLGDVTRERGAEVAVAACTRLGVPLTVVGPASAGTESAMRRVSGLGDDLVLTGPVSNRRALELLGTCSVGLCPILDLPNYRYSQPTKILEYLAMGVPVVASDLPGTRDLVQGLEAVFLTKAGDIPALTEAISAARDPRVIQEAAAQAPLVRERFRWPADQVGRFYEGLVSPG